MLFATHFIPIVYEDQDISHDVITKDTDQTAFSINTDSQVSINVHRYSIFKYCISNTITVTVLLGSNFLTLSLEGASGLIRLHFTGNPRGRGSYVKCPWKNEE